jgi:hypothetical protein
MLAAHVHYAQVEPLWTCLRARMEEDIKARQDKLDTDNAKRDADQGKRRAGWQGGKPFTTREMPTRGDWNLKQNIKRRRMPV